MEKANKKHDRLNIVILILLAVLITLSAGLVINNYFNKYSGMLPASDTYFFCSQSNNIVNNGELLKFSPDYTKEKNVYTPGFYILLAEISLLTGLKSQIIIYLLPLLSLSLFVLSLALFFKIFNKTKKALFVPTFILAIALISSSFIAFRDLMIGIPQTFYFFMIILGIVFLYKINDTNSDLIIFFIILEGLFLSHFISAILVLGYFILSLILNFNRLKKGKLIVGILILTLIILPVFIRSGSQGVFNPQYAKEFNLQNFIFSEENINRFINISWILLSIPFILISLTKRKLAVPNIFTLLLIMSLMLINLPFLLVFSPYIKRIMVFLVLFLALTLPMNVFYAISNQDKYHRLITLSILVIFLFLGIYSYTDRSWVKYFQPEDLTAIGSLNQNYTIIAIFPYNLLIQCYLESPTKNIIRINLANLNSSNMDDYKPNNFQPGTQFYYNLNTQEVLKKSGLNIDEELTSKLIQNWEKQSQIYKTENISIYKS
jgi:hypothetical protein